MRPDRRPSTGRVSLIAARPVAAVGVASRRLTRLDRRAGVPPGPPVPTSRSRRRLLTRHPTRTLVLVVGSGSRGLCWRGRRRLAARYRGLLILCRFLPGGLVVPLGAAASTGEVAQLDRDGPKLARDLMSSDAFLVWSRT